MMKLSIKATVCVAAIALASCEHVETATDEEMATEEEAAPSFTPFVLVETNEQLTLNLPLSIPQNETKLGFYSDQSGVTCQPDGKHCVGYGARGGDVELSNWVGPVSINIMFGHGAGDYEFYPNAHDSISVGPASSGPPPSREWNAEFINLSVSADRKTLSFVDRNDPGSGAFEYTITVLNTATGQPVIIDPTISNKGDN